MNRTPKKLAALLLALVMVVSLLPAAFAAEGTDGIYKDVRQTDEFFTAVTVLYHKGLMWGVGGGKFDPDGSITRGQAVTVLYRLAGEPDVTGLEEAAAKFSDIDINQYYAAPMIWAIDQGIILGNGDGTATPNAPIIDEHANLIVGRYAKLAGLEELPTNLMREFTVSTSSSGGGGPQGGGTQGGPQGGGTQGGPQGGGTQGGPQGGGTQGGPQGGGTMGGGSSAPAGPVELKRSDYAMGIYELVKLTDGNGSYSLDLNDYMDQWIYITEDAKQNNMGALLVDGNGEFALYDVYDSYALMGLNYCANPADPYVQTLDIYVPADYVDATPNGDGTYTVAFNNKTITNGNGTTYSVDTAPIIYQTTIDGYAEGYSITLFSDLKGTSQNTFSTEETKRSAQYDDYLEAGYILVVPSSRGRDSEFVDGTAPAPIVDLKAGVRYLKANADVMPGDTDKIIAIGGSAGGSCVALLAASGNSHLYDEYLDAIGAADAKDDIFGVRAMATIANVHLADAAYAYLHQQEKFATQGMGANATRKDFNETELAIHNALIASFEAYITDCGLDTETFMDEYTAAINDALNEFVGTYYAGDLETFYATAHENNSKTNEYLKDFYDEATGLFDVKDPHAFVAEYMTRSKGLLGFDQTNLASGNPLENLLFSRHHFSQNDLDILKAVQADGYTDAVNGSDLADLIAAYGKDIPNQAKYVKLMSVLTFLVDGEQSDIAPHWHLCNSTMDGDVGSMMAYLMYKIIDNSGCAEAEYHMGFDQVSKAGHGYGDFSFDSFMAYIDADVAAG